MLPYQDVIDLNPCNGICLSAFYDNAFDKGLITITPDDYTASLSNAMRDRIKELESRNYSVADVEVSYVLAWHPREEKDEVAVCLANVVLSKLENSQ